MRPDKKGTKKKGGKEYHRLQDLPHSRVRGEAERPTSRMCHRPKPLNRRSSLPRSSIWRAIAATLSNRIREITLMFEERETSIPYGRREA